MSQRQRQRDTVYGFVRCNCKHENMIDDIINIIIDFYLIVIESNILSYEESETLLDLLHEQLKKQDDNKFMKYLDADLLFRASEHQFSATKYHEICDGNTNTLTIIQNEHEHVYGGYASIPLAVQNIYEESSKDMNAFLFAIRPFVKYYGLKEKKGKGECAVHGYTNYGPVFGEGEDLFVEDKGNEKGIGAAIGDGETFEIIAKDFFPNTLTTAEFFKVTEYEIFKLNII